MHLCEHGVCEAQLVERFAVVVSEITRATCLRTCFKFCVTQRIASDLHPQLEPIAELLRLDPNLPFIVAIQAKRHPHDAVKAALGSMPESHQRDLAQIERPTDVELSCRELVGSGLSRRSHRISFGEGTEISC